MKLQQDELKALQQARTEDEWNKNCDVIKAKQNGQYPEDWYQEVISQKSKFPALDTTIIISS